MVPRREVLSMVTVTRVPGGKGSDTGSILFWRRPHVRPPSNLKEEGKLVIGRQPSSSLNVIGFGERIIK